MLHQIIFITACARNVLL